MDTRAEKQKASSELLGRRSVPVVKIKNPNRPNRFLIINLTDFDADKHVLWEGEREWLDREHRALDS